MNVSLQHRKKQKHCCQALVHLSRNTYIQYLKAIELKALVEGESFQKSQGTLRHFRGTTKHKVCVKTTNKSNNNNNN